MKENLPKCAEEACDFTSTATYDYNCVGFVTGDFLWWHPEEAPDHYWPPNVPRDFWARTYVLALQTAGFEIFRKTILWLEPNPQPGYEIVAVYHRGGLFKHVAQQVLPGIWKSKLGELEDLEHPFSCLHKSVYGKVFAYLRRPQRLGGAVLPQEYRLRQSRRE